MDTNVLLIEPDPGALSEIAPELELLDFRIHRAANAEAAVAAVEQTPLLALVLIDDRIGRQACVELVGEIKRAHPDLPILLQTGGEVATAARFDQFMPDAILDTDASPAEIAARAHELLCQQLYPAEIVAMIRQRALSVFAESFASELRAERPCLRANRNTLASITAVLSFCGRAVSGRLIVSGEAAQLSAIYRRLIPGDGEVAVEVAEDLAGEMANQILGRIKDYFVSRGAGFEMASPVFLHGLDVAVRYKAGRPSLVIPCVDDAGTLYVQFCVDRFDPDSLGEDEDDDSDAGGSFMFL